jgi:hypothetical protein
MRLVPFNVDLLQVMLDLFFHFIFIFQQVLELIVLLDWLLLLQDFQQLVLLLDDRLDLLRFEVLVQFSLCQVASQLLGVVLVLFVVFLDLAVQAQVRMIVFLLVELLGEEGQDVEIGAFFNLHDNIEGLLHVEAIHGNLDGLDWHEQFPDSVVNGGESKFLSLEGLYCKQKDTFLISSSALIISLFSIS